MNKKTWVVGVSGGADSMALLDMYKDEFNLIAAHVNYHKRSESDTEELLVKKFCEQNNIPFYKKDYQDEKGNFQQVARDFRYEFYKEVVEENKAEGVMVAHHSDDSLETYLFHKQRGSQSNHVGIHELVTIKDITVYRPLLKYRKKDLYLHNQKHNVPYMEDKSNQSLDYTRNEIRYYLSGLDDESYLRLLDEMREEQTDWHIYQKSIKLSLIRLEDEIPLETYKYNYEQYGNHFLRKLLKHRNINVNHMSDKYLTQLHQTIIDEVCEIEIDKVHIISSYNILFIGPLPTYTYTLKAKEKIDTSFFKINRKGQVIQGLNLDVSDYPITIRTPHKDDSIQMRFGKKKINRFFIDRKIPVHKRKQWTVVENAQGNIIFVSKLGCDVDHYSTQPTMYIVEKY